MAALVWFKKELFKTHKVAHDAQNVYFGCSLSHALVYTAERDNEKCYLGDLERRTITIVPITNKNVITILESIYKDYGPNTSNGSIRLANFSIGTYIKNIFVNVFLCVF